ncbi:hypothetical protein XBJ2_1450003 [Xenorhabdus bovienii str. Jollieti]|uniref:Uncharacterized protein n=1 Tax=Xenorhabdus bovienii (strain SS-2004) TaxID=406818 RepID=D3V7N6_XENBS|nr:hypothetical protein [Xenorhabdus bovienii]CBJ81848.1 hypothetical protein XBJ1_2724 [Xenorhabdus bovienii SS-2004]CDH27700.1 hypothetical protein XBJ2_1450003 [Xenorhabdus bovienii str. Jollieti]
MSNVMTFSQPETGNLIIGQTFLFTVILSSDEVIDGSSIISFFNTKNISVPIGDVSVNLESDNKKATATVTLTVSNLIAENEEIHFSVKTSLSGIQQKKLQYLAKEIYPESLRLSVDNAFLSVPTSYDHSQIGTVSTKVHTIIKDKDGNPLSGIPIFIKSRAFNQLEEVYIYANDVRNKINVQNLSLYSGFSINSGDKGQVEFYISPIKPLALVIDLSSTIRIPSDYAISHSTVFIIFDNKKYNRQEPEAVTAIDGDLTSKGESKFWLDTTPCTAYDVDDFLLFNINGEYKYYVRGFDVIEDNQCLIKLPYFILEKNKLSNLSYLVIRGNGDIIAKSYPVDVTYRGRTNKPWTDVDRIYEPCKVYTSFNDVIEQDGDINNQKISNHAKNPDDAGLFVTITGTNDNSDNTKVKLGSKVTLNLYINSKNKTVTLPFNCIMPYHPDNKDGKTAVLRFNIRYKLLNGHFAFPFHDGMIYFDYQVGDDNDRDVTYGGIWSGHIVTD